MSFLGFHLEKAHGELRGAEADERRMLELRHKALTLGILVCKPSRRSGLCRRSIGIFSIYLYLEQILATHLQSDVADAGGRCAGPRNRGRMRYVDLFLFHVFIRSKPPV